MNSSPEKRPTDDDLLNLATTMLVEGVGFPPSNPLHRLYEDSGWAEVHKLPGFWGLVRIERPANYAVDLRSEQYDYDVRGSGPTLGAALEGALFSARKMIEKREAGQ